MLAHHLVSMAEGGGINPRKPRDSSKSDYACIICRSRKVRCDKSLPSCRNCHRLGVPCPGYSPDTESISRKEMIKSADDIFRAAGVEKRRVGSCASCRASKHRCSRDKPSCRRCLHRGIPCVYSARGGGAGASGNGLDDDEEMEEAEDRDMRGVNGASVGEEERSPATSLGSSAEPKIDLESLCSETLPQDTSLRYRLINTYFKRSHRLRCLSFLHKATFLQSVDRDSIEQDYGEPLLYIICALGAWHLYFDAASTSGMRLDPIPGSAWAEKARRDIMGDIHAPTVQQLMTMALLCDYAIRNDQNALAFILVAYLHRVIRLLGLDTRDNFTEQADPAEIVQKETENRLVWACYFIDMFMGTGVDKNTSWRAETLEVPLPSLDPQSYLTTSLDMLNVEEVEESRIVPYMNQLNLSALTLLVGRLRFRVLKLIRTPPHQVSSIWGPSSPLLDIVNQVDDIITHLPRRYQLPDDINTNNSTITSTSQLSFLQEKGLLSGVFFLHFLLHAVIFDLTRISLEGFNFPLATAFVDAPPAFRLRCQKMCRAHAADVASLLRRGMALPRGAAGGAFDDIFCADAALECAKIEIIYAASVDRSEGVLSTTRMDLETTMDFLEIFHRGRDGPSPFMRTLIPLCMFFGFKDIVEKYKQPFSILKMAAEVTGPRDIEHLSEFAPFRRAKAQLAAHRPSHSASTRSTTTPSSSQQHYSISSRNATTNNRPSSAMAAPSPRIDNGFTLRPEVSTFPPPPAPLPAVEATLPPLQMVPGIMANDHLVGGGAGAGMPVADGSAGTMNMDMTNGVLMQASVEEYIRAAEEMSNYLALDISEFPPYMSFNDVMPPV